MSDELLSVFFNLPEQWLRVVCVKAKFVGSDDQAATHLGLKRTTYNDQLNCALRAVVYGVFARFALNRTVNFGDECGVGLKSDGLVNAERQIRIPVDAGENDKRELLQQFGNGHPSVVEQAIVLERRNADPPHLFVVAPRDIVRIVGRDRNCPFAVVSRIIKKKEGTSRRIRIKVRFLDVSSRKQESFPPEQIQPAPNVDYRSRAAAILNAWRELTDLYFQ